MAFLRFPDGFLWGSGTSAHQVEGGNHNNDWWAFEQRGKVENGEKSEDACDQYNRYADDFAIAAGLGQAAHKISVEWSRVEPEPGLYDEAEIQHYVDVVMAMRAAGLKPFVTLHHFTSPLWICASGCWEDSSMPERFAAFVRVMAEALGPHVEAWITINEPMALVTFGYVTGWWPPERRSVISGLRAVRNLMHAHRLAYDTIKSVRGDALVGVAVNATALELSASPTAIERFMIAPYDWVTNWWYLDRVRNHLDFIGLQYYSRATARTLLFGDPRKGPGGEDLTVTDLGWAIYPHGLQKVIRRTWRRYELPIYITENGLADHDDVLRKSFIFEHLRALHASIEDGADVRGYLHWSLIDNFEWRHGFGPRVGLVEVDYEAQERRPRDSADYFAGVCRDNGVEVAETRHGQSEQE